MRVFCYLVVGVLIGMFGFDALHVFGQGGQFALQKGQYVDQVQALVQALTVGHLCATVAHSNHRPHRISRVTHNNFAIVRWNVVIFAHKECEIHLKLNLIFLKKLFALSQMRMTVPVSSLMAAG